MQYFTIVALLWFVPGFEFVLSLFLSVRSGGCSAANDPSPSRGTSQIVSGTWGNMIHWRSSNLSCCCGMHTDDIIYHTHNLCLLPSNFCIIRYKSWTSLSVQTQWKTLMIEKQTYRVSQQCFRLHNTCQVKGQLTFLKAVSGDRCAPVCYLFTSSF